MRCGSLNIHVYFIFYLVHVLRNEKIFYQLLKSSSTFRVHWSAHLFLTVGAKDWSLTTITQSHKPWFTRIPGSRVDIDRGEIIEIPVIPGPLNVWLLCCFFSLSLHIFRIYLSVCLGVVWLMADGVGSHKYVRSHIIRLEDLHGFFYLSDS